MAEIIPKINSIGVHLAREYILKNTPENVLAKYRQSLTSQENALFFGSKGYNFLRYEPEEIFFSALEKYNASCDQGEYKPIIEIGRYTGLNVIPQVGKAFLKPGNFAVLVLGVGFFWRIMHTQGHIKGVLIDDGQHGRVKVTGGYKHIVHCKYIQGFILSGLELLCAGKKYSVKEESCVFNGAEFCEYSLSWES